MRLASYVLDYAWKRTFSLDARRLITQWTHELMHATWNEPFMPRLRADLEWSKNSEPARWIARDPLTASFYAFSELEWRAVHLMTGGLLPTQILTRLKELYPASGVDQTWLNALLNRLQLHHLLIPARRVDSQRIVHRLRQQQRTSWWQPWLSPLSIRIPLLDPTPLLHWARPHANLLFHPLVIAFNLLSGLFMAACVIRELLELEWHQAIDWTAIRGDRWLMLLACYLLAKSLHELGHALACAKYSAQCREVGIMLLCLAPCLYCDTTDSWKLSSKWQRATIAAAGMYVEWILATLAAAVWLVTQAGTVHHVAASLMIVCSIGTLLINLNPLLKYDGYYILSDLWGVPNLADQSREALRWFGQFALTGSTTTRQQLDAPKLWLAMYAVVAAAYRTIILLAILWLIWELLVPLGLGLLAIALTGLLLLGVVLGQTRALKSFIAECAASGQFRRLRGAALLALLAGGLVALCVCPLPSVIRARGSSDFKDKVPIFATQTAELLQAAPLNQWLPAGSYLAEFSSFDSQLELLELSGRVEVLAEEVAQMQLRSALDPSTAYELPTKLEQLQELRGRQAVLIRELEALTHSAANPGYLVAAAESVPTPMAAPNDDRFQRRPLEESSQGVTCERSSLVGWFTPKQQPIMTVMVPEQDVKRLRLGMRGAIQWDSFPDSIGLGTVTRIAPEPIRETPRELVGDPRLLSARDAHGVYLPEKPHYEVTLEVSQAITQIRGAPATVQFNMPPQTLWERGWELLRQNVKPL